MMLQTYRYVKKSELGQAGVVMFLNDNRRSNSVLTWLYNWWLFSSSLKYVECGHVNYSKCFIL